MRKPPLAFVDESYIHEPGHPGAYLLAAVLIESEELSAAANAAHAVAANKFAPANFHTSIMWQRGHVGAIEDMLDVVEQYAGWTVVVIDTPIVTSPSRRLTLAHREKSRQACLARLLIDLNQQKVRDVILDSRGSYAEWTQVRSEGRKLPAADLADVHTYRRLAHSGEISHRMRLIHDKADARPPVWLADAVAWAARRALSMDEPQWWLRVANVATVVDAHTGAELRVNDNGAAPPHGERDPHSPSPSARPTLLPAQGPPQGYGTAAASSHTRNPLPVGAILTSVMRQSDAARIAPRASTDPHRLLLDRVQSLSTQVRQLGDDIAALHDPAVGSTSGPAPDSGPSSAPHRRSIDQPVADID